MAFAAGTIWHGWSSGSVNNGGGFDPTCAGMLADLTTDSNTGNTNSPVVSSASYNFGSGDVGAKIFIQSGTNWIPGWYDIVSVAGNKATLTASIGTAVLYGTVSSANNYQRPNGLNTTAGCATVGTPTGGTFAIDYSQQTGGISYSDLVIDASTNTDATSVAKPLKKVMLGNIWNVTSGTGFTVQRVQLVSIPSGNIGRFDKSLGTTSSTGGNATMGGAVGSSSVITVLTVPMVAGNKIFIKGSYTLAATTTVTASASGSAAGGRISVEGFTTYPGQMDGRPTITANNNTFALLSCNANSYFEWKHLTLSYTGASRGIGATCNIGNSGHTHWYDCLWDGCSNAAIGGSASFTGVTLERCEIKNCTQAAAPAINTGAGFHAIHNYVHDNAGDGFGYSFSGTAVFSHNIITGNGRYGILENTGSGSNAGAHTFINNTIANNVSDGIRFTFDTVTGLSPILVKNIFYNNGASSVGYNINWTNVNAAELMYLSLVNEFNAYYNNTGLGNRNNMGAGVGDVTLTGNPFTNTATGDWSLNNTAGAGAACRGISFTFPGATVTGYGDIGAVQHVDPVKLITPVNMHGGFQRC